MLLILLAILAAAYFIKGRPAPRVLEGDALSAALEEAEYPSAEAETAVRSAASLVGKVHYFWGGKSFMLGPDPDWGKERKVTSEGNSTTGTVRPFGLDCSGLVTWAYIQAGYSLNEIGNGTWNQWFASEPIEESELRPGDLGFQREYPGSSGNHVGIFLGYIKGKPYFIHCTPSYDNVVVTQGEGIFNYFRRPAAISAGAE